MNDIKLTQYAHGAGCGCKISPAVLESILHSDLPKPKFPSLLVGNESRDDAAVYDLGNGTCIISTTDFFTPIVDDPSTFGAIASVNAISDVYAMGGRPIMAIAILGWPVNKLPPEVAAAVLEGSRKVCAQAGIPLAGGHSVDCPEPIFGLAVTGTCRIEELRRNNTTKEGDLIYLTKPIGVGMVATAAKRGVVAPEDLAEAIRLMSILNEQGPVFAKHDYVTAMTDVTGFGLLGHLIEVCEGSGLSATIDYSKVPLMKNLESYSSKMIYPDNTMRNWSSYQAKVNGIGAESLLTLCDPQTSGGLLVFVSPGGRQDFQQLSASAGLALEPIGMVTNRKEQLIYIQ